jgi:hypothetical protein
VEEAVPLTRRVAGRVLSARDLGFNHFEPVTFTLGPAHAAAKDWMGATVTCEGKSKRFPVRVASRGAVFLPLRHTSLSTSGPPPGARLHRVVRLAAGRREVGLDWILCRYGRTSSRWRSSPR